MHFLFFFFKIKSYISNYHFFLLQLICRYYHFIIQDTQPISFSFYPFLPFLPIHHSFFLLLFLLPPSNLHSILFFYLLELPFLIFSLQFQPSITHFVPIKKLA